MSRMKNRDLKVGYKMEPLEFKFFCLPLPVCCVPLCAFNLALCVFFPLCFLDFPFYLPLFFGLGPGLASDFLEFVCLFGLISLIWLWTDLKTLFEVCCLSSSQCLPLGPKYFWLPSQKTLNLTLSYCDTYKLIMLVAMHLQSPFHSMSVNTIVPCPVHHLCPNRSQFPSRQFLCTQTWYKEIWKQPWLCPRLMRPNEQCVAVVSDQLSRLNQTMAADGARYWSWRAGQIVIVGISKWA